MLHASLHTLRDVGIWKGEVASIQPGRVGQLFLDVGSPDTGGKAQDGKQAPRRKTSAETKKSKINLLGHWLGQEDTTVRPGNPEAGRMLDAYREAFEGTERGRSKRVADENKAEAKPPALGKKLDDLTDSLMQGMAWVRWQENMELLRSEGGVKQLLRSK
ncbi:hypothetical protein NUW58_g1284 [Xylaria curta]|uniref:Uncharacterized protein n=1 Tax=Xylaria curta TaxID=42375 RepID=A0ACC1PNK1_9PEZI|nr:hypothetical protein NUW58_g1284 [Xylaria curta]